MVAEANLCGLSLWVGSSIRGSKRRGLLAWSPGRTKFGTFGRPVPLGWIFDPWLEGAWASVSGPEIVPSFVLVWPVCLGWIFDPWLEGAWAWRDRRGERKCAFSCVHASWGSMKVDGKIPQPTQHFMLGWLAGPARARAERERERARARARAGKFQGSLGGGTRVKGGCLERRRMTDDTRTSCVRGEGALAPLSRPSSAA